MDAIIGAVLHRQLGISRRVDIVDRAPCGSVHVYAQHQVALAGGERVVRPQIAGQLRLDVGRHRVGERRRHVVGHRPVGVLLRIAHDGVEVQVVLGLGVAVVVDVHAYLRRLGIGEDRAGDAQIGRRLLLVGVAHPHEQPALVDRARQHRHQRGRIDIAQAGDQLVERRARNRREDGVLIGRVALVEPIHVAHQVLDGVGAVDRRAVGGLHAAGHAEQVLQEHRIHRDDAIDRAAVHLRPELGDTASAMREIGVVQRIARRHRHSLTGKLRTLEKRILLVGDGHTALLSIPNNLLKITKRDIPIAHSEQTLSPRKATRRANLGVRHGNDHVISRLSISTEHLRNQRRELISGVNRTIESPHSALRCCHKISDLGNMGLSDALNLLIGRLYGSRYIRKALSQSLEHLDVDATVAHHRIK